MAVLNRVPETGWHLVYKKKRVSYAFTYLGLLSFLTFNSATSKSSLELDTCYTYKKYNIVGPALPKKS